MATKPLSVEDIAILKKPAGDFWLPDEVAHYARASQQLDMLIIEHDIFLYGASVYMEYLALEAQRALAYFDQRGYI